MFVVNFFTTESYKGFLFDDDIQWCILITTEQFDHFPSSF